MKYTTQPRSAFGSDRKRSLPVKVALAATACLFGALLPGATLAETKPYDAPDLEVARIQPEVEMRFDHNFWPQNRPLDELKAHSSVVLADLEGPGIIKNINLAEKRIRAADFEGDAAGLSYEEEARVNAARGIILEIYFENSEQPAVRVPMADFFLAGANYKGFEEGLMFETEFIVEHKRNRVSYFPMPFRERAKIVLVNDTQYDLVTYDFVEWEKVPKLPDDLGYFHATYSRRCVQLHPDTKIDVIELSGKGQVIGQSFTYVTESVEFANGQTLMEANIGFDIDGRKLALDYLGSECFFNQGWGFRDQTTMRSGTTMRKNFPKPGTAIFDLFVMTAYRFFDHAPIRFNDSLHQYIDWSDETNPAHEQRMKSARDRGMGYMDLAAVTYWYQDSPAGYDHEPIRSLEDRRKLMLKPSQDEDAGE